MALYLTNSFSINMFPQTASEAIYYFRRLTDKQAWVLIHTLGTINAIGHPDTDRVVRGILEKCGDGAAIPAAKRITVQLGPEDAVLVAQYSGPRLPEGTTQLPDGARLEFWLVTPLGMPARKEVIDTLYAVLVTTKSYRRFKRIARQKAANALEVCVACLTIES